jgi:Putative beta-barrel porin-2, OmpL-like. bbp2
LSNLKIYSKYYQYRSYLDSQNHVKVKNYFYHREIFVKKTIKNSWPLVCAFFCHQVLADASGYVDGSYNYLEQNNTFSSGLYNRVYDVQQRGFTLHQVAVTLSDQPKEGFGGLINMIGGHDAKVFAPYGWASIFDAPTVQFYIPQAFVQYAQENWTIAAGTLLALVGAEGIDPTSTANFSRAILNGFAEPFTLLGVRSTYAWDDKLQFILGVNNGWDDITDPSRRQTIEVGTVYSPSKELSFSAAFYSGEQRAVDATSTGPTGTRNILDLVATMHLTDELTFVVNYDYANQTLATVPAGGADSTHNAEAIWQGVAGYLNYKFSDAIQTSLRGEFFADVDGYRTGEAQHWSEVTFSVKYNVTNDLFVRVETRHDFSNLNVFNGNNGVPANYQQSYALEMAYNIF